MNHLQKMTLCYYWMGGQAEYESYCKVSNIIDKVRFPKNYHSLETYQQIQILKYLLQHIKSSMKNLPLISVKYFAINFPSLAITLMNHYFCYLPASKSNIGWGQILIDQKLIQFSLFSTNILIPIIFNNKKYFLNVQTKNLKILNPGLSLNKSLRIAQVKKQINEQNLIERTDINFSKQMNHLAILCLAKALKITLDYTTMRKQFQKSQNNTQQRKIIQFQQVHFKIINAISILFCISSFIKYNNYDFKAIFKRISINIIQLRECCGGFGYMRISGLPEIIQLVFYCAHQTNQFYFNFELLKNNNYLKKMSRAGISSQVIQPIILQLKHSQIKEQSIFGIWLTSFIDKLQNVKVQNKQQNLKTFSNIFLENALINAYYFRIRFKPKQNNIILLNQILLHHILVMLNIVLPFHKQLLQNKQSAQIFDKLRRIMQQNLVKIFSSLDIFREVFMVKGIGIIYGRENQQQFYKDLMENSLMNNNRNDKEAIKQIIKPLKQYSIIQQSKL